MKYKKHLLLALIFFTASSFSFAGNLSSSTLTSNKKEVEFSAASDKKTIPKVSSKFSSDIDSMPPPIAEMIRKGRGVKFQDKFNLPGGMTGYAMSSSTGERRIYYVTPDKKHAILGIMFDSSLKNITADHQLTYINFIEFSNLGSMPLPDRPAK